MDPEFVEIGVRLSKTLLTQINIELIKEGFKAIKKVIGNEDWISFVKSSLTLTRDEFLQFMKQNIRQGRYVVIFELLVLIMIIASGLLRWFSRRYVSKLIDQLNDPLSKDVVLSFHKPKSVDISPRARGFLKKWGGVTLLAWIDKVLIYWYDVILWSSGLSLPYQDAVKKAEMRNRKKPHRPLIPKTFFADIRPLIQRKRPKKVDDDDDDDVIDDNTKKPMLSDNNTDFKRNKGKGKIFNLRYDEALKRNLPSNINPSIAGLIDVNLKPSKVPTSTNQKPPALERVQMEILQVIHQLDNNNLTEGQQQQSPPVQQHEESSESPWIEVNRIDKRWKKSKKYQNAGLVDLDDIAVKMSRNHSFQIMLWAIILMTSALQLGQPTSMQLPSRTNQMINPIPPEPFREFVHNLQTAPDSLAQDQAVVDYLDSNLPLDAIPDGEVQRPIATILADPSIVVRVMPLPAQNTVWEDLRAVWEELTYIG